MSQKNFLKIYTPKDSVHEALDIASAAEICILHGCMHTAVVVVVVVAAVDVVGASAVAGDAGRPVVSHTQVLDRGNSWGLKMDT